MLNLDLWLCVANAILLFASAFLAGNPKNKYSIQVKILKILPRVVLGLQFLVIPFLVDDITVVPLATDLFTVSDGIRVILWGSIILFAAEVLIQILNVKYGRAEICKK